MRILSAVVGFALLALVSQSLAAWPVHYAWQAGIGATEWGHWVLLPALLLVLLFTRSKATRPGAILCALAAVIAAAPAVQAALAADRLQRETESAWGQSVEAPYFSATRLFTGVKTPPVTKETREYAPGVLLDLYTSPNSQKDRCVIVVHGGSWCRGSRLEFTGLNPYLAARGFTVAALDYRLAPQNPYPAAVEDLQKAREFLVANGCTRFAWVGRSAGGHLALLAGYRNKDQGVAAFYPPTDMVWSWEHPSNPLVLDSCAVLRDFLKGSPQEQPDNYTAATPLHLEPVPTLLLHGGRDDLVFPVQSQRLQLHAQERKVPCQLLALPWANHGFDINFCGPSAQLSTGAVLAFLKSVLP